MVTIETPLAQDIVERTMKVIPFNVNVMNARGFIVGSGTPERIGSLHPGAQLALAKQDVVEIGSVSIPNLPGAKAGINLPLTVRGHICGVVGVTGNPDDIRQFGELVRVTAEILLEQSLLISELQRENRYREEFVLQLVKPSGISDASMTVWAARLNIDLRQSRAMFVLELSEANHRPDLVLKELQSVQSELAVKWPNLLTAMISPGELAILDKFDPSSLQGKCSAMARKRLVELNNVIRQAVNSPSTLSMGISLPGLHGAAASYQSARQTTVVGKERHPELSYYSYYDLSFPVLLSGLDSGWQAKELRQPLLNLEPFDQKSGTLIKTLDAWFKHNNHPISTAKALHIHRNTLDYRLSKISELTGLDLSDTDNRLLLYVAMQLRHHTYKTGDD